MMDTNGWNPELVYKTVSDNQLKNLMLAADMRSMFAFLGLHGYKRYFMCKAKCFFKWHDKTQRRYIDTYRRIIPQHTEHLQSVIPMQAYSANADETTAEYKRKFIKDSLQEWCTALEYTLGLYAAAHQWAIENQCPDSPFFDCLMKETAEMYKKAARYREKLAAVNYDMVFIMEEQQPLHRKYKHRLHKE